MPTTDPIAELLTRIRNASMARHPYVLVPPSKLKSAVVEVLKEEGFIANASVVTSGSRPALKLQLIYGEQNQPAIAGLQRVSKPSLRIYAKHTEIPRVYGGIGTTIVSTSKGVMSGRKAWKEHLGGEVLCVVW